MNCWEYMKCGREAGGAHAEELGICPVYPFHGTHCARIAGTLCGGEVKCSFARKVITCCDCEFYMSEHYDSIFKELLPY